MSRIAVYPGSFDPITRGHLAVIENVSDIFDRIVIGVGVNPDKNGRFTTEERLEMIREAIPYINTKDCDIEMAAFTNLATQFARSVGASKILRGTRTIMDSDVEMQMGHLNARLAPEISTMFVLTPLELNPVPSSYVMQIAKNSGDFGWMVTPNVEKKLRDKYGLNAS